MCVPSPPPTLPPHPLAPPSPSPPFPSCPSLLPCLMYLLGLTFVCFCVFYAFVFFCTRSSLCFSFFLSFSFVYSFSPFLLFFLLYPHCIPYFLFFLSMLFSCITDKLTRKEPGIFHRHPKIPLQNTVVYHTVLEEIPRNPIFYGGSHW